MQNPIFRDPSGSRRVLRLGTASVLFTFSVASALFGRVASAQKAPAAPVKAPTAPIAAPATGMVAAPVVAKKSINVLIIAMDDESTVVTEAPSIPVEVETPLTPPSTITPDVPLTGVTPTRFQTVQSVWRALALKKPKATPTPVLPLPEFSKGNTPDGGSIVGLGIPVTPQSAQPGVTTTTPGAVQGAGPLPGSRPVTPPGRSLLAALPLARALNGMGYADAQATSLDGAVLVRAMGEKRLSPVTLSKLLEAMKSLDGATRLPQALRQTSISVATSRAKDAAASVGQATGYRAVIAIYMPPFADGSSTYTLLLSDSAKETGEPIVWSEAGANEETARQTGAGTGAALIDRALLNWTPVAGNNARLLADAHFASAREKAATNLDAAQDELLRVIALDPARPDIAPFKKTLADARLARAKEKAATDIAGAQNDLAQAVALDPTRADLYMAQGDLLASTNNMIGAAQAYRRASEINSKDGTVYEKVAISYANATPPDWPRALEAGKKALALGTDTANLRIAMARAQFGRADLFRAANVAYRADDAETEAQNHIERALQLSPNNPDALRLLARSFLASGRTAEAAQTLSRVTTIFPKDAVLQEQYAQALVTIGDRKADAFAAYAKLWKMTANTTPIVDDITYATLIEGFDERVFSLGKTAGQLSDSVAAGNIARESGFLQLTRLKADMSDAEMAITSLQVPGVYSMTAATARQFAAGLMTQSLEAHQNFLDSGQDTYRTRARDLYKQAVAQLNSARNAN